MKRLADEARGLIQGVSMKDLKSTAALREQVRTGMQEIAAQLDSMVVKGGRKFRFEE